MQIDPEDFKRHYALLSDDALLEINPEELVDAALPYYEAELAERKLAPPGEEGEEGEAGEAPNLLDDPPGHTQDGLKLAATFLSMEEANFAGGLLQSADISCFFENDRGAAWTGIGELRLMVPATVLDRACEILESEISDEDLIAQAEAERGEQTEASGKDE